ncbi:hypothetical protein [Lentzea albidocapillata]|uniref:Ppx/GppA phosphatase family protein n=1 Tax=Lentzea albidocapillata TaxID=40571 RepID=A0A1W1ZYU8_9PSEU|nr:hypothetical protein [Lentzea albidocapillata]SMC53574.1 Ppx/GppA phosphatase family protein [Lentzea albidocapillata]
MSEEPCRVGVLDVGCFSAHLVVVDRHEGSLLHPVLSHKVRLRLDQALESSGEISPAGMTGARAQRDGLFVARQLRAADLEKWIPRLAKLPAAERTRLPGISEHRAHQSLAGAIAARALMEATGHDVVDICPWSTREGLLITLLEQPPRHAGGGLVAVA